MYSDESKAEGVVGMVGGGWYESEETRGGVAVGEKATVWDGETEGMELALKVVGGNSRLILSDSRATIMTLKKASILGMGRTRGLKAVVYMIEEGRENHGPVAVSLAWGKAHGGISGNERVDLEAKAVVKREGGLVLTEGGVRACIQAERKVERVLKGFGVGRVSRSSAQRLLHL